ncbi:MAG: FxLYD domain-containing protein [Ginsengibacter sp.]
MKKSFVFLFVSSIILFACNSNDAKKALTEKENYELTKKNLRDKEIKNPQIFLSVAGSNKHNLVGQTVVKGIVVNKATVAVYKDVDVQLEFYSKTGTLLETDKETVYETIHPGQSKSFKTKYFAPRGSDSVALKVLDAKIVE